LSDPNCEFCTKTEATANYLSKNGQRYATPPVRLRQVESFGGAPAGENYVYLELDQNKAEIVDGSGKVVATDQPKSAKLNAALRWVGGRWTVLGVESAQ
jgi:hypothetical protein